MAIGDNFGQLANQVIGWNNPNFTAQQRQQQGQFQDQQMMQQQAMAQQRQVQQFQMQHMAAQQQMAQQQLQMQQKQQQFEQSSTIAKNLLQAETPEGVSAVANLYGNQVSPVQLAAMQQAAAGFRQKKLEDFQIENARSMGSPVTATANVPQDTIPPQSVMGISGPSVNVPQPGWNAIGNTGLSAGPSSLEGLRQAMEARNLGYANLQNAKADATTSKENSPVYVRTIIAPGKTPQAIYKNPDGTTFAQDIPGAEVTAEKAQPKASPKMQAELQNFQVASDSMQDVMDTYKSDPTVLAQGSQIPGFRSDTAVAFANKVAAAHVALLKSIGSNPALVKAVNDSFPSIHSPNFATQFEQTKATVDDYLQQRQAGMPNAQVAGQPMQFQSVSDAETAASSGKLPEGSRVVIAGKPYVWHNPTGQQ